MTGEAEVIWHEVECAGYAGDLAAWRSLADEAAGPVLELGCGAGRVSLDLARRGVEVTGLDRDRALLAELGRRAGAEGIEVETVLADARDFELGREFALAIAPMQILHLMVAAEREGLLRASRAHLAANGRLAAALLAPGALDGAPGRPPLPDVRERDGWIYSSQPLDVVANGEAIEVRRLRQTVSPEGDLSEEVRATRLYPVGRRELEARAAAAGFVPAGALAVEATEDHVGSEIVILEAA